MADTRRPVADEGAARRADTDDGSFAVGADLGGTKVSAVLVDGRGDVVADAYRGHDGTIDGAIRATIELVESFADAAPRPSGVAVAAAGIIDRDAGVLVHSALLGARAVPLAEAVAARLQVPVRLENDANAALIGTLASSARRDTAILIALGTGVGGAISLCGDVVAGASGFAGEFGHIPVEDPGFHRCPCGSSGCLELFASGTAAARHARRVGILGPDGRTRGEDLIAAAVAGDTRAEKILDDVGRAVGTALVGLIAALDPDVIYLAGGFGHAAAPFITPALESRLAEQRPFPASRPAPAIQPDPVGPLAAAFGAARLARRTAQRIQTASHSFERGTA